MTEPMKKLFLMAVLALSVSYYASAEWTTYYVLDEPKENIPSFYSFKIDWDNNYFFLDSDSENETQCPIKNLKTNGKKKTFDVYYTKNVGGGYYCSIGFEDKGNGGYSLTLYLPGEDGKKLEFSYNLSDKKPLKDAIRDAQRDPKSAIKDGIGKVTEVFKKKKEENKEKKEKKE